MNTFGNVLRLTTFGESHGPAVGGVLDGLPPGLTVDFGLVREMMARRRPGSSPLTSARREADEVEFLSGISPDGRTLGTPVAFIICNGDTRPGDYEQLRHLFRPNHADYTYQAKYGLRDHRGGGRASARETAARVAAAALAMLVLRRENVDVSAKLIAVGGVTGEEEMRQAVLDARRDGDSVGGLVECTVTGLCAGIGDPVFDKLQARIAFAMLSIPGAKGFEYGDGFALADARGSEVADIFSTDADGNVITLTNHSGGIQGGISNGMPVVFRVPFKPTPTLMRPQQTIDDAGRPAPLEAAGRHDPCIALRAVEVVRAMTILTLADAILADKTIR